MDNENIRFAGTAERLRKLADFIEKLPHEGKLRMEEWAHDGGLGAIGIAQEQCGTSACVAGWATVVFPEVLVLVHNDWKDKMFPKHVITGRIGTQAFMNAMDLTETDAYEVCFSQQTTRAKKAVQLRNLAWMYEFGVTDMAYLVMR